MSQGETIIDGYELINCLATGNVSQVWEAKQAASGQTFAMKLLLPEAIGDSEQRSTMKHEASVCKQMEHPNIIHFVDSKVNRKFAYIIMEMFRSSNLKAMIRSDLHGTHVRLQKLMECCTQAYAYMHEKNWIHKDIKPDNILLTKGGEVRVIDFSLASRPSSSVGRMVTRKKSIAIQGTRTYIAPELIRREKLTKSVDIYSLGVLFYEALSGRPPFMGTNPNELLMAHVRDRADVPSSYHSNVSSEADALVMRMLSKKPQDRPESMQALFSEIRSTKIFKQDPEVFNKEKLEAEANERLLTIDQRLDSRADAGRTEKFGYQPMEPQPAKTKPPAEQPAKSPAAPAAAQTGGAPAPTGQPPTPQPAMPQPSMYPYPMQPQVPMQPMMPPPMAGGAYPPGMPVPPQPGMPPWQQYPPMPQPGQMPAQPGQPQAPPPATPTTAQPPPPQQAPPPQPAPAPPAKDDKELDTPDNLDWLSVS